ncbi:phage tail tape measure protein [Streptomyces pacificus]|uniref:Phage tail tape measure protein domain-containing protein n=1 Tax=Streptomyces pacificus TaxID=2705029 RepID=A0A6A0AUJ1_9ACTN|nr:phage tail tape measure protein [Streptomyces pacificus]GFH36639.1 hypothetical protein SCWH03_28700 [Streptomyces pacificus]
MALTVGELNALLTVDDRAVNPGLRRAEDALRSSGQRMADDADQAGRAAGQALGEGLRRDAAGQLIAAQGRFIAAGRQVGQAAGDAVGDGIRQGTDEGAADAATAAEGRLDRLKTAAMGIGLAAGAALMVGMGQALDQSQITARLGAQLGATPAEAQRYGKIAGQMYGQAITADFQSAADAIRQVMANKLVPADATNAQIQSIATNVADLANTFEIDLGLAATAAGGMIKNGMAKDGRQAMDILAAGMKGTGTAGEDLVETFSEYSPVFKAAGVSGATAMGLIKQALAGGWVKDTDKLADAIKEFSLRAVTDTEGVQESFKALGLNSKQMAADIAAGGTRGEKALDKVLDKLRGMPATAERAMIVQELFGGPGEDLGAALFTLDVDKASKAMAGAAGSADELGDGLRDSPAQAVAEFRQGLHQAFINVLGGQVIPAIARFIGWMRRNEGTVKAVGAILLGVLVPALVMMGVTATVAAGRVVVGWTISGAAALRSAAVQVAAAARTVAGWLAQGAAAAAQGARVAAAWVMTGARAAGGAALQLAAGARVVAGWVLMGVQSLLQAGRMAAAWLIAMGPVGWVIAAVVGLVALIIANWDTVKRWTAAAWDWIWQKVQGAIGLMMAGIERLGRIPGMIAGWFGQAKAWAIQKMAELVVWAQGLPGRVIGAISSLGSRLWSTVSSAFERFKRGAILKAAQAVVWLRGLPGRISGALGNLGSLLVSKGRDVVRGLWSGIQSMGGWLRDTLTGWARNLIPGPIAKALGIASPSKVMARQVGRWIPAGIIDGIQSGQGVLDSTMAGLVTPPHIGAASGTAGGVGVTGGGRAGRQTQVIVIRGDGSARADFILGELAHAVSKRGGNVQLAVTGRRG